MSAKKASSQENAEPVDDGSGSTTNPPHGNEKSLVLPAPPLNESVFEYRQETLLGIYHYKH